MSKINLIGIAGNGFSGKDTLYLILEKILKESKIETDRVALADPLKSQVSAFVREHFNGISVFTKNKKEKEFLRPFLVVFGKLKRQISNGKFFTDLATPRLLENIKSNILTIVTDIRYMYYETDEVSWLRDNKGLLVYIERVLPDGLLVQPANEDERENNEKIKQIADYKLVWPTTENEQIRIDYVKIQLKQLIERIVNEKT